MRKCSWRGILEAPVYMPKLRDMLCMLHFHILNAAIINTKLKHQSLYARRSAGFFHSLALRQDEFVR